MADAYKIIKTHLDEINQPDYLDKSNEERDELLESRFKRDGALIDYDEYYSLDYLDMEEVTEYVARLELEKGNKKARFSVYSGTSNATRQGFFIASPPSFGNILVMSRIDLVMTKKRLVDTLFKDYTSRPMINFLWEKKRKNGWLTRDDTLFVDIMKLKQSLEQQQLYLHDQIYFKEAEEARYTLILNTNDEVVGVMDLVRDIDIIKKKMSGSSAPMETNRDGEARGSDRLDQAKRLLQRGFPRSFESTIRDLVYASNQKTFEEQNAFIESWLKAQDKSVVGKFEKYYTVDYSNERAVMEYQAKQIVEKDGAKVRFSVYPGSLYDKQGKQGYFVVSPDRFSQHKMYYAVPIEPPKMNEEPDHISQTSESSESSESSEFLSMDDIPEPALRTPPKAPKKEERILPKLNFLPPKLDKFFSSEEEEENFPPPTEGLALRVSALTFF